MRKLFSRSLALVLAVIMLWSMVGTVMAATYRPGAQSGPSSSYKGGRYYNELEVYGTGMTGEENIAQDTTVHGNGVDGYTASIVDGILGQTMDDGHWFGIDTADGTGSVTVDLCGRYQITGVNVHLFAGGELGVPASLSVSVSSDGNNFIKLGQFALTAEQQALIGAYDTTMMDAIVKADASKIGNFVRVNSNFKQLYPSVSFDGAFAINFYCAPAITVDDGMTLYWWDMETMASVDKLTVENATGSMEMTDTNGMWWGQVAGIAAKEMDKTYYVSCVFESGGETITTGVIPYSLGKYCSDKAAADGDTQQAFAQATAVYGYYAKNYFASLA